MLRPCLPTLSTYGSPGPTRRAALAPPAGGRARGVLEDAGVYGIVVLPPGGAAR
ncbi:MAG TPA: hypothetical protein VF468_21730 [Actinomycetota bacterium]|nr:hypothetical protein [Actinomycetota bacterium]